MVYHMSRNLHWLTQINLLLQRFTHVSWWRLQTLKGYSVDITINNTFMFWNTSFFSIFYTHTHTHTHMHQYKARILQSRYIDRENDHPWKHLVTPGIRIKKSSPTHVSSYPPGFPSPPPPLLWHQNTLQWPNALNLHHHHLKQNTAISIHPQLT